MNLENLEKKEKDKQAKIKKQKATELVEKYKGKVFKDKDLKELGFKFKMSKENNQRFVDCLKEDTNILKKFGLTDYSLLVSVHYDKHPNEKLKVKTASENFNQIKNEVHKNYPPVRICASTNGDVYYCFSIIDFLIPFSFNKNVEKKFKLMAHFIKRDEDNNISAEEPDKYADRMVNFVVKYCLDDLRI